jgi:hypothetical protein
MKTAKTKTIGGLLTACLLLHFSGTYAQLNPKTLRVGFLNESMGLPSGKLTKLPIHPTINVGTDFRVRSGKHWQRAFGTDFYYYYQRSSEHALMLDASYRLGYKFNFGLQTNLTAALGYKHAILTGDKYKLRDGEYHEVTHWGKSQFTTKLGIGMEYPISEKYSLTTDYKAMVAAPFGDRILPFSLHTFLGVGVKINLQN